MQTETILVLTTGWVQAPAAPADTNTKPNAQ